ncbi:MAG: hypothetical protein A2W91_12860 [Bacteroidetes bacterium GWF2_38_335]|nr:MAG: hypothetical protein A2W91_12860 [Bacteroidetes bacterium GWF2_38_335]HBS86916.1 hypothetical protein [Bacteroidales bacterium]
MKKALILSILLFTFFACEFIKDKKESPSKQSKGFISRIHKSSYETDWYKLLGETDFDKHTLDIKDIDWEKEYKEQTNKEQYNYPIIEVLDTINYIYLSITISPDKQNNDYQFCIGLGVHLKPVDQKSGNDIGRKVKLFLTNSSNINEIIEVNSLMFNRKYEMLKDRLKTYTFLAEIDDLYQNIP